MFSFSYESLLGMEIRELKYFAAQARKEKLKQRLSMIQAFRVAQATDKYYSEHVSSIVDEIQSLEIGHNNKVKESWESLKLIGRVNV